MKKAERHKITEKEASQLFFKIIMDRVNYNWESLYKELKGLFKKNFVVQDNDMAKMSFSLALLAFELECLKNKVSIELAKSVEEYVISSLPSQDRQMLKKWLDLYRSKIEESTSQFKRNPMYIMDPKIWTAC